MSASVDKSFLLKSIQNQKKYFSTKHFDIDNINHIIMESLVEDTVPFNVGDIKEYCLKV